MIKLIAEIGQAHDGSLGMVYAYIDALALTGVNAVKFQVHIADAESSIYEPFRIKFSKQDKTRFDYWKRMEFSTEEWREIKKYCEAKGMEFMASPFSIAAVELLEEIGIHSYKIGSGEVNNLLLLEKIAQTNKPIILSSGMSSFKELDISINFLKEKKCNYSVMQCTTSYPTQPEQYGLNVISELKERYNVPVGFSDHSARKETLFAAATLGAVMLEFHVIFDRTMFGPDATSSLTIVETKEVVTAIRNIETALNNPIDKNSNEQFKDLKQIFEKSLAVNKDLPKGHVLTFEDLEAKKPKGYGLDASQFKSVIGKTLNKDIQQWGFLNEEDVD